MAILLEIEGHYDQPFFGGKPVPKDKIVEKETGKESVQKLSEPKLYWSKSSREKWDPQPAAGVPLHQIDY